MTEAGEKDGARERLITAAARHFAEHGFEGASQRAIQREAEVNSAAAHYYFGSKEALYRQVVETHLAVIQAERRRRLEAIPATTQGRDRLEALVRAYIVPHMELALSEAGRPYGRILARVLIEPFKSADDVFEEWVLPVREMLLTQLRQIFPRASDDTLFKMVSLTVILMADVPYDSTWFGMTGEEQTARDPETWIDLTQRFACAGIESLYGGPPDG